MIRASCGHTWLSEGRRPAVGTQSRWWSSIWREPSCFPKRASPSVGDCSDRSLEPAWRLLANRLLPVGVQQAQVRNEVLLIVPCQNGCCRSQIGNRRIERRLMLHHGRQDAPHVALDEESGQDGAFSGSVLTCPDACDVTLRKSKSSRDDPQLGRIFIVRANLRYRSGQIETQGCDAATVA
jgi:hypothetical protein